LPRVPRGGRGRPRAKTPENRGFLRTKKFRAKTIRHAGRRRVCFRCRGDESRPITEQQRFSSAAVPPPKDPHLDSRYRTRGFPNHGSFSFYTPAGPSMAPAGFRGCGASQGCPEPRAVAPPGDRRRKPIERQGRRPGPSQADGVGQGKLGRMPRLAVNTAPEGCAGATASAIHGPGGLPRLRGKPRLPRAASGRTSGRPWAGCRLNNLHLHAGAALACSRRLAICGRRQDAENSRE